MIPWGPEEAPTLYFKGSKPGAATAKLEPHFLARNLILCAPSVRRDVPACLPDDSESQPRCAQSRRTLR